MLDVLRKKSKSWIIYILFGIIIVVFVINFGPASQKCGQTGRGNVLVAKVFGNPINLDELETEFSKKFEFGPLGRYKLNSMQEVVSQKRALLNEMIDQKLWLKEAENYQIDITDKELSDFIKNPLEYLKKIGGGDDRFFFDDRDIQMEIAKDRMEYFTAMSMGRYFMDKNEQFDYDRYKKFILHGLVTSIQAFENSQRDVLKVMRFKSLLKSHIQISDREVLDAFQHENTKAKLCYVKIDPKKGQKKITVSKEDIDQYKAANEKAMNTYYEKNKKNYDRPEMVKARQIFIKLTGKDEKVVLERANKVLQEVSKKEADFAKLATQYTENTFLKKKGGLMNYFPKGRYEKEFDAVVFGLKVGEVKPFKTPKGYYIVKLEGRKDAVKKSFKDVVDQIAEEMVKAQKAQESGKELADLIMKRLEKGEVLSAVVPEKAEKKETELGEKTGDGKKTETKPAEIKEKKGDKGDDGEETGVKGEKGDRFKALLKMFDAASKETRLFTRSGDLISGIGSSKELAAVVFGDLNKKNPTPKSYFDIRGSYYVVQLMERTDPDLKNFESEKLTLKNKLLRLKQIRYQMGYFKKLKEKASTQKDVYVNEAVFQYRKRPEQVQAPIQSLDDL